MSLSWVPNAISAFRILLVIPLVMTLLQRNFLAALVLIFVAGFSDVVDGFLARTFDWRTRLGGLLDPAADKLLLVSTFISLAWLNLVPTGLAIIVVVRDLTIVAGALGYQKLVGNLQGEPSLISKFNTACQLLFVLAVVTHAQWSLFAEGVLLLLGALVVFTTISSGLNYVVTWSRRASQEISET